MRLDTDASITASRAGPKDLVAGIIRECQPISTRRSYMAERHRLARLSKPGGERSSVEAGKPGPGRFPQCPNLWMIADI